MDRAVGWAKHDNVPEVVISEHGNNGDNVNIQMFPPENFGIILEEGIKKLSGVFLSEPPDVVLQTSLGEEIIAQIKKWWLNN